jgi:hypothetical protein
MSGIAALYGRLSKPAISADLLQEMREVQPARVASIAGSRPQTGMRLAPRRLSINGVATGQQALCTEIVRAREAREREGAGQHRGVFAFPAMRSPARSGSGPEVGAAA